MPKLTTELNRKHGKAFAANMVKSFGDELRKRGAKSPKEMAEPLWKGPCNDGPQGGITQSLIGRWLNCRDRFRLYAIEGLQPFDKFNHRLGYGQMWHKCEETLAADGILGGSKTISEGPLRVYCQGLCKQYPMQQKEIEKWYQVCKTQFPFYVKHYSKRKDQLGFEPLLQEETFHVPYTLPSGRVVYLRGRWDGVDLLPKDKKVGKLVFKRGIYLFETKTKGDVDELRIEQQLKFDLQTMMYLVALQEWQKLDDYGEPIRTPAITTQPIQGVRYNVIKRPLSGGKGSITQHQATKGTKCSKCKGTGKEVKAKGRMVCPKCKGVGRIGGKPEETSQHFYQRLGKIIEDNSDEFFYRWTVQVTQEDIETFRRTCLDPMLEQIAGWYSYVTKMKNCLLDVFGVEDNVGHWRHPYGVYNILDDGGSTDYDQFYETGSIAGLTKDEKLFKELE